MTTFITRIQCKKNTYTQMFLIIEFSDPLNVKNVIFYYNISGSYSYNTRIE